MTCLIEGIKVQALVDTGSMRSFINKDVYTVMDFNNDRIDKSDLEKCRSITGGTLDILGRIDGNLKFPASKQMYNCNFLICNNIQYDCVLGWDFLVANNLDLRRENSEGNSCYLLRGRHGKTQVCAKHPPSVFEFTGVVDVNQAHEAASDNTEFGSDKESTLLFESRIKSPTHVTLVKDVIIPGRTEIMLEGRLEKEVACKTGIISSRLELDQSHIHVANIVVSPKGREVPIRVMNSSEEPIEVMKDQKIATFQQLTEIRSKQANAINVGRENFACGAALSNSFQSQVEKAISPHLNEEDKHKLNALLNDFTDVFNDQVTECTITKHRINTENAMPIKQRPRRLPYAHREEAERQIKQMLDEKVIRHSNSPWSSPIVLVYKKSGELRFCVDYRKLNQITRNDAHPLPRISDLLDSVKDAKYFSTLDLRSGYWQIPVEPEDCQKTAFVTQSGLYEFTRMPFGLKTAPATFQRAMEIALAGLTFETCLCYLDDVIVFVRDFEEHNSRLRAVLKRFRQFNLKVKLSKCVFAARQVCYLGHVISRQGVAPDPAKIDAVRNIPPPSDLKQLRSFLGLTGYYRRFVPQYATVAAPLTQLTTKEYQNKFSWTEERDKSFRKLKDLLCSAPVLSYPNFKQEFILQTDASDVGVGAILSQYDKDGVEHVIAYSSRALSPRERNYSTTEKEAYAIQFGTQHFRVYLVGRKFTIITDHNALKWLNQIEPKGRVARWLMDL